MPSDFYFDKIHLLKPLILDPSQKLRTIPHLFSPLLAIQYLSSQVIPE